MQLAMHGMPPAVQLQWQGCACNVMHEAPCERSAHRGIDIASEFELNAQCPGERKGGGGGRAFRDKIIWA